MLALAACDATTREARRMVKRAEGPSEELSAIDSLMWRQPDSAFALLKQFAESPQADSLDEFNGHYCQLLISELLYKNDWGQSNREELLQAVAYFDSLVRLTPPPPLKGGAQRAGDSKKISNPTPNLVFLAARAHYINGVGYYEKDSIVQACAEYLKTLEVMEAHFEEKELVGHKARFLAYTYNRLGDLFSEQFMMESAITCYENALVYCKIEPTSPIGVSNILYRIGIQYDKKNEIEKAISYYSEAIENMAITDNMVYRDIVASKALFDYKTGGAAEVSLDTIRRILLKAETDKERLNRYLAIGGIYFSDGIYDSARYYLEPVFENCEAGLQGQAANYLYIIYDKLGNKERSDSLVHHLTSRKESVGDNKALVSRLEDLYKNHSNQKLKRQAEVEREKSVKKVKSIIIPTAGVVLLVVVCALMLRNKKILKIQQDKAGRILVETEQAHEKELRLRQAEADKVLEETKKKHEEELEQLKKETERQMEVVKRKHQQRMAEAKERHSEELRTQKDRADKEMEKTKKRHEKELEAERLAYRAEMAEKETKAQTERRLHEETLTRHQVETEQRMSEAERKHRQKLEEIARKHELEMQAQQDKTKKEAEQTRKRHESELNAERQAHQQEMEAKAAEAEADRERHEEELRRRREQAEQRLAEAEQDHRRKVAELAKRQEEETRRQQEKMEQEREQAKKRHEAELEAERMAYQKERETLRQSLWQREAQVNALETAMVQQREEAERRREAFLREPICQHINELLHGRHITTRDTSSKHEAIALKEEDYKQLKEAVERHYAGFDNALLSRCPSLRHSDLALCHLHLMELGEREIAALRSRTYSGIKKQNESLQEKLGVKEDVASYIMRVIEGLCGIHNIDQTVSGNKPLQRNTEEIPQESTLKSTLKGTQKTIVEIIIGNSTVTIPEIAKILDLNPRGIAKHFKTLQDKGVIRRVGPDKGGHWEVVR